MLRKIYLYHFKKNWFDGKSNRKKITNLTRDRNFSTNARTLYPFLAIGRRSSGVGRQEIGVGR
jgi:hypothetical protein